MVSQPGIGSTSTNANPHERTGQHIRSSLEQEASDDRVAAYHSTADHHGGDHESDGGDGMDRQPSIRRRQPGIKPKQLLALFFVLGLLNNASYVIMIACAKSISEGGTALVFIANVMPSLLVKLSAPYWFDRVSYQTRLMAATVSMVASFTLVAVGATISIPSAALQMQLLGVALASLQCGLGEASALALAGRFDSYLGAAQSPASPSTVEADPAESSTGFCLTGFSSGTGLAGVFGFLWKFVFSDFLGWSLSATLWSAMTLAVGYCLSSYQLVRLDHRLSEGVGTVSVTVPGGDASIHISDGGDIDSDCDDHVVTIGSDDVNIDEIRPLHASSHSTATATQMTATTSTAATSRQNSASHDTMAVRTTTEVSDMDAMQRFRLFLSLWPYMIPLFLVYVAEYSLQAGTWTAIGFPVTNVASRDRFFEYGNWMYQAGVFVSRSSGTIFTASMFSLWLMPLLQVLNVFLFGWYAMHQSDSMSQAMLLPACFYVGLLGGGVYIHGYKRICIDLPPQHREFALAATSVAEGVGTLMADLLGLVIQGCLYQWNHLEGALVACPAHFDVSN